MCIRDRTGRSFKLRYIEHTKALHSTTESTFANYLIEANHTYKNIDTNMDILHEMCIRDRTMLTSLVPSISHTDV